MSQQQPRGLGKGLEALLGGAQDADRLRKPVGYVNKEVAGAPGARSADIVRIPIGQIQPNPYQPRKTFDADALDDLAASIRTLGLIQPITVRRMGPGSYQIISGERRFKASCMAGLTEMPAYVRDADDRGMLEMAIVENVQRENLDPIEIALSYQQLLDECHLTQEQMADRLGKKRASVANQIRLLKLPAKVQHDLKVGLITVGHAKVLLGLEDPQAQQTLCDLVVRGQLNVRQLEQKVAALRSPEDAPRRQKGPIPQDYTALGERLGRYFGGAVSFSRSASGKGTMTIKFDTDARVREFLDLMDEKGI